MVAVASAAAEHLQAGNAAELVLGPAVSQPGATVVASATRRSRDTCMTMEFYRFGLLHAV